jgi:hypothetical protein
MNDDAWLCLMFLRRMSYYANILQFSENGSAVQQSDFVAILFNKIFSRQVFEQNIQ